MNVVLMTFNASYIHKALSLRWLYVARDTNHEVQILEFTIKDDLSHCVDHVLKTQPDVVACSTYIWNIDMMKKFIVELHKKNPKVRIILGGPEVSYESEDLLALPIECILRGEGEVTLWQAINNEQDIDGYLSTNYCSLVSYAKVNLAYLETLESPYFLDFDLKDMNKRYFYFETSRGCPYRCSYCLSSLDNQVRTFSKEYIQKQLTKLTSYEVKQVKLLDRTFNASDELSFQFIHLLEGLNTDCSFQFEIVVDRLSKRMISFLLEEATVSRYRFEIGIQSFHLPTLEAVERWQDLERCKEVIRLLTERGYQLHVDLIGGLPYENLQQFEQSFNQLFETKAKEIQVGILKLLKGTKLKSQCNEFKINYDENAPYTTKSTQWMSEQDIQCIHDVYHATEKFYNSGRCYRSLHTLVDLQYITSPFLFLNNCGKEAAKIKQIQIIDYFNIVFNLLNNKINDQFKLQCILLTDYYLLFKQRPKKLFNYNIDVEIRKKIFKNAMMVCNLSEEIVYNYTEISYGYIKNSVAIQLVVYSKQQVLPTRIWFDINNQEVILDERNMDCNN